MKSSLLFLPFLLGFVLAEEKKVEFAGLGSDALGQEFYPAVAVAQFTGPTIIGEFNFYQDASGEVTATGAFQKGLKPGQRYRFRFHEGTNCDRLGEMSLEHEFTNLRAIQAGGTAPVQEKIDLAHLTGNTGLIGSPWVLSDGSRDLACVVLKKT
ncbi:hypothetical protein CU098_003962 [Rhizopus stolonifer]|uniref:Superoxide dismutase copper/zinc binding domain-containing protein n=1 Tax=Rhizopus stolonifer TaxID=4846 RepID=A0A367IT82_RHIST|nr:hypothetical protein CU098_003962 [Rhizopus stolonifer]